jgi:hypothetical protein
MNYGNKVKNLMTINVAKTLINSSLLLLLLQLDPTPRTNYTKKFSEPAAIDPAACSRACLLLHQALSVI